MSKKVSVKIRKGLILFLIYSYGINSGKRVELKNDQFLSIPCHCNFTDKYIYKSFIFCHVTIYFMVLQIHLFIYNIFLFFFSFTSGILNIIYEFRFYYLLLNISFLYDFTFFVEIICSLSFKLFIFSFD